MANRFLYFFFSLWFLHGAVAQQRVCHTEQYDSLQRSQSPYVQKSRNALEQKVAAFLAKQKTLKTTNTAQITIPVVVHVIHQNSSGAIGGTNISDEKILSQIDVLNADFRKQNPDTINTRINFKSVAADSRIQFCMATQDPDGIETNGITRTYSGQGCFTSFDGNTISDIISWPTTKYLNIWVCNLCGDLQGFAQLPDGTTQPGLPNLQDEKTDGVVVDYEYMGTVSSPAPYNLGRPCVHEVGHWLGLLHPWNGFGCGSTDHVSDTPLQNNPTFSCPTSNMPCGEITMYENFMGYDYDNCMSLFTQGQVDRMWAVLNSSPRRIALFNSPGCCGAVCRLPYFETFENEGKGSLGCEWKADDQAWTKSTIGAYGLGDSSIVSIKGSIGSDTNIYYSPSLDFNNTPYAVLSFDLAYAGNGTQNTDTLIVEFALNCNEKWIPLTSLYGNSLLTTSRIFNDDSFVPMVNEWAAKTVKLPPFLNENVVQFRFRNITSKDQVIYLDNINVIKENPTLDISIYPNPVVGDITSLDIIYSGYKDVEIQLFNSAGVEAHHSSYQQKPSFIYEINTRDLAAGLYIVRVTIDNETAQEKFIKN